jgi:hypothetical protein
MHISYKYNIHFFGFSFIQLQGRLANNDFMRFLEIQGEVRTRQTSMVKMVEEVPSLLINALLILPSHSFILYLLIPSSLINFLS